MKKFLTIFFVVLGVIFFIIILIGVWFYVTDPLNLKPLFLRASEEGAPAALEAGVTDSATVDSHPYLNETQETALENLGINPAAIPTQISPEQEACFVTKLGQARVDEIVAGAAPSASDLFTARERL